MLESSIIITFLSNVGKYFSSQFESSAIIQAFLHQKDKEAISRGSMFAKIFNLIVNIFKSLFVSLKLDKLLDGSIFAMPFLFAIVIVAVSPFFPTMVLVGMSLISLSVLFVWLFSKKENKLKFFTLNKYILIYCAVYMYAAFASVTRISSIKVALVTVSLTLFYFVIVNSINTKRKFNISMFIFLTMGIIVSLYGIYQYMFPNKYSGVWLDTQMFEDIKFRAYSTFANPNVLGEYLLLTIPFAFAYIINGKSLVTKFISFGIFSVMILCLLLTYSRGCYIGILLAVGVFLVLWDKRFIWFAFIGLLLLPLVMPESIINRFTSIGNLEDSSTSYRVNIWLGTINMLKDYWICGTGPGIDAFNQVYPLYSYNTIAAPHSHNLFLQLMCDAGIIGVGTFIAILYKFFRTTCSYLSVETDKESRVFIIASIAAIIGFAVQSMFDYTFYNYKVVLIFWMTLAFGIVTTKLSAMKN